jgi:hypothetical protein
VIIRYDLFFKNKPKQGMLFRRFFGFRLKKDNPNAKNVELMWQCAIYSQYFSQSQIISDS